MKKWAVIGFAFLFLSACSGGEKSLPTDIDNENQTEERKVETEKQETEREKDKDTTSPHPSEEELTEEEPLTGRKTKEVSPYRPVAVMVNNHRKARPQSGIGEADIVYEVLTEGDVTRLLAIFHSNQPEMIGPVRSARGYFIELASGYDSLFVFHGWSPEAEQMLRSGASPFLNGLFYDGTLFQRSTGRSAPHNSYITYADLLEGLEKKGYDIEREVEPNVFEETPSSLTAEKVEKIDIQYGNTYSVQFEYNHTEKTYERSSDHKPSLDENTQEQVAAENVFVVEASHQVVDSKGRRNINFRDGGDGILFQNGKAIEVKWKNEDGRLVPEKNGEKIAFVPGSTWINVVPSITTDLIVNGNDQE